MSWLSDARSTVAVEKILDAAAGLFAEEGVANVGMNEIASAAGCSRATLYRYFDTRDAVREAYLHREARLISREVNDSVEGIVDPQERLTAAILNTLKIVRESPALSAWFRPDDAPIGGDLAAHSDVVTAIGTAFLESLGATPDNADLRARWIVRVIVSLLTYPEDDPADERAMVSTYVAPAVATSKW
ncbi:TetR/AcrR family transcriptional regulator [Mycobacterium sp. SM3041]|jgi:AcrR family transcriptional regulator|uniref:TetR/AcrR family transcriptional regulator n=1 Tax=Mycobacterium sp. SM3041 TaxID=3114291 RepID=UPI003204E214